MSDSENNTENSAPTPYSIIKVGSQQYKVCEGSEIKVNRIEGEVGDKIDIDEVLLKSDGSNTEVGTPTVSSSKVVATITGHSRGKKVLVFKKKRRKGYKKKIGHRQELTSLKISSI